MDTTPCVVDETTGLVKRHGLSVGIATVFLAGEMAGSGVLALPRSIVGTGPAGLGIVVFFALLSIFIGTRLGICWIILEERYPELRNQIRDPYPLIAEKATGKYGRLLASICIILTLYGAGCVFINLMAGFLHNIASVAGLQLNQCLWMVIVATVMIPFCWLGTPNDFWPIAVGALLTTAASSSLMIYQLSIDSKDKTSCYFDKDKNWKPEFPTPEVEGFFKAFSSIQFAYAGASTFPTIQADMKDRRKFPLAATVAMFVLLAIYFPLSAVGYFELGSTVSNNVVESLCDGTVKIIVEFLLLLHLSSVFPIVLNPPNQYFEELLKIPKHFNVWRCVFRTLVVLFLLFISESLPNFGSILDLIGGSTITLLTFVFPPFFYMRLMDMSSLNSDWEQRKVHILERIVCWIVIFIGLAGGGLSTYNAVKNIINADFTPCYVKQMS